MTIVFNQVTWYSKLGAIILFLIVVPILSFTIGRQYELAKLAEENAPALISNTPVHTIPNTPAPLPAPASSTAAVYGTKIKMSIGDTATFSDGLKVYLAKINDSLCKAVCVWAGELSPSFDVQGGSLKDPVNVLLGTVTKKTFGGVGGYTFTLVDATTESATIIVSNK